MPFSTHAFGAVYPLLQKICAHPFNQRLADGTLPRDKFIYYLQQDSLYLVDFAASLARIASRSDNPEHMAILLAFAQEALITERALHDQYFKEYAVPQATCKQPACLYYTSFLKEKASHAPLPEAMAATLPCFWIYQRVGMHLTSIAARPNPYQSWLNAYSSDEYASTVGKAVLLTEDLYKDSSKRIRNRMLDSFMIASHLEYDFWDDAFHLRARPFNPEDLEEFD